MIDIEKIKEIITICEKEYTKAEHIYFEKKMRLDLARAEYQKVCPHENLNVIKKGYSGGYDYKAEYHTDTYCKDCGAFLGREIEYGTFG